MALQAPDPLALPPETGADRPAFGSAQVRAEVQFECIYEHFDFIWRTLCCFGLRSPQIEDAAQDVLLTAYRRLDTYEGRSAIRTWLFGIAYRVALNHRRQLRRKGTFEELHDNLVAPVPCPEQHAEQAQALRLVEQFLDTLDDDRRAVFVLCENEQLPAPEVSEVLGVKLNTVYSRLRLARRDFHRALKARRRRP
jgi:RNA polymerase sigma-70 factor (ECF subfamily)